MGREGGWGGGGLVVVCTKIITVASPDFTVRQAR